MVSGVAVNENCINTFTNIVKGRKFRGVLFKINEDMTEVLVDKTFAPGDGSPVSEWDECRKALPNTDCRYIAYDMEYDHQGARKSRLIFILWSPETSKVRSKMIYASSQEGVINKLEGIQRQLQCTDEDDLQYDVIVKQLAAHTATY